ncbi:hypothetical protein BD779DRAFT_1547200 [Infundibulicybe gibba]|nr:hypothetical protein BD779DRAFT_1547200 [Infundibulicybe gibba]
MLRHHRTTLCATLRSFPLLFPPTRTTLTLTDDVRVSGTVGLGQQMNPTATHPCLANPNSRRLTLLTSTNPAAAPGIVAQPMDALHDDGIRGELRHGGDVRWAGKGLLGRGNRWRTGILRGRMSTLIINTLISDPNGLGFAHTFL